jgi:hypothetical protein
VWCIYYVYTVRWLIYLHVYFIRTFHIFTISTSWGGKSERETESPQGFRYNFAPPFRLRHVQVGVMCPDLGSVHFDAEGRGKFLPKRLQQFTAARCNDPITGSRLKVTA